MSDQDWHYGKRGDATRHATTVRAIKIIDAVAERPLVTQSDLMKAIGTTSSHTAVNFISQVQLLPWLTINTVKDGYTFVVDHELREICEARRHRPQLGTSYNAFLKNMRREITRRREEANAQRAKRNWQHDAVLKMELVRLLNWIETELDKLPS